MSLDAVDDKSITQLLLQRPHAVPSGGEEPYNSREAAYQPPTVAALGTMHAYEAFGPIRKVLTLFLQQKEQIAAAEEHAAKHFSSGAKDAPQSATGSSPAPSAAGVTAVVPFFGLMLLECLTTQLTLFRVDQAEHRFGGLQRVLACSMTEYHTRMKDATLDAFFRKRTRYAELKSKHLDEARQRTVEALSIEETFRPIISDYAKQVSAPKTINDFFPRGLEWKKSKEKKLAAKRSKWEAEQKEVEDELFRPWQMSDASRRILAKRRQQRQQPASENHLGGGEGETTDTAGGLPGTVSESPSPTRPNASTMQHPSSTTTTPTRRRTATLHHQSTDLLFSPTLSTGSRFLVRDLPPFEYRMRVELERRKNQATIGDAERRRREAEEDANDLWSSPKVSAEELQRIADRLHSPVTRRQSRLPLEGDTFRPQISPRAAATPSRVQTPTRRQLDDASAARKRREAAREAVTLSSPFRIRSSPPAHAPSSSTPVRRRSVDAKQATSPRGSKPLSAAAASFLQRYDANAVARSHQKSLLASRDAEAHQRAHPFQPWVCPGTRNLTAGRHRLFLDDPDRGRGDATEYIPSSLTIDRSSLLDMTTGSSQANRPTPLEAVLHSPTFGGAYTATTAPLASPGTPVHGIPHGVDPQVMRQFVRLGLYGKPTEAAFSSPFRSPHRKEAAFDVMRAASAARRRASSRHQREQQPPSSPSRATTTDRATTHDAERSRLLHVSDVYAERLQRSPVRLMSSRAVTADDRQTTSPTQNTVVHRSVTANSITQRSRMPSEAVHTTTVTQSPIRFLHSDGALPQQQQPPVGTVTPPRALQQRQHNAVGIGKANFHEEAHEAMSMALDAETLADLKQWWGDLTEAYAGPGANSAMSSQPRLSIALPQNVAVQAAVQLAEMVTGSSGLAKRSWLREAAFGGAVVAVNDATPYYGTLGSGNGGGNGGGGTAMVMFVDFVRMFQRILGNALRDAP